MNKIFHGPGFFKTAYRKQEILNDPRAVLGMNYLGVKLDAPDPAFWILKSRRMRVFRRGGFRKPLGKPRNVIAMAHPTNGFRRDPL